jgi:superfamily II DNA or RNA helicase
VADVVPGLYETLITDGLARGLAAIDVDLVQRAALHDEEADQILATHVAAVVRRALAGVGGEEKGRVTRKVALANALIEDIARRDARAADPADRVQHEGALLHGVAPRAQGPAVPRFPMRPGLPMAAGALLVNGRGQPRIGHEVAAEMRSADSVDLLCAFLKWHGVLLIEDAVRDLIARGGRLRVITTTYIGATDQRAVDRLTELGASVKVSYDTHATRLHAKAWNFRRATGLDTAYVGSSNLSRTAMLDGLEWNVRVSGLEQPAVLEAVQATFDEYWEDSSFEDYEPKRDGQRLRAALQKERGGTSALPLEITALDVEARPYQREVLEQLDTERLVHDRWRNLIVMATGTGKTVVSALDYRRLRDEGRVRRLLFVAHRQEILRQSQSVFRQVLKDGAFGELYVGGEVPTQWEAVFASVQSLARMDLDRLPADHFDMVIVDEFHHAGASSYERLLKHVRPVVLVGLTATPERTDGLDVRTYFDGRVAAELRLWDALDQQLLAPFQYFGSHDDVDLTSIRWTRGNYDQAELENLYTGNDARVRLVLQQIMDKVSEPAEMRALGFCVSVAHAEFMANRFNAAGIPSLALSAMSPTDVRRTALGDLRDRKINVIFTVDLFNEGIDLPTIDTILFLRPTESATVFLQQLGRGLRRSADKACLTVLDFIGGQSAQFRFDERFRALSGTSRKELPAQVEADFPTLPAGCHIQLDRVAKKVVLDNIKSAVRLPTNRLAQELRRIGDVSLADFLDLAQVELEDVYRATNGGWTKLRREAGFEESAPSDLDQALGRRIGRMLHIDDPRRLSALKRLLGAPSSLAPESTVERRLRAMLATDLFGPEAIPESDVELRARLAALPFRREELESVVELLEARQPRLTSSASNTRVPLRVHARYSRDEALGAFGMEKPNSVREGVKWLEEEQADVFFVTLTKVEGHYSPSTMYADRAISPTRFQWESQNRTSVTSETGQRYMNHRQLGSTVHLFLRETKSPDGDLGTPPYFYAGTMQYESHSGDRPIRIMWRLDEPLPIDVFQSARLAS